MESKAVDALRAAVRGEVIAPTDAPYEEARRVYNAMIDKHPAIIVRCTGVADVIAAVRAAQDEGLPVAVRGGGHSVPGFGTADGALVVDISRMKGIRVDPRRRSVRAEGGCTWGDFNHATGAFGLATTGGIISTTGIGGLTLGGGLGYLTRRAGLTIDNLLSADVVLADGSFVTASADTNRDLYWALRGGGGNFGVVTSFEYRLYPVANIVGGPMFFEVKDAPAVLRAYDRYIATASRQLGAFFAWQIAPPLPFIPKERHGDTLCAVVVCWTGPPDRAAKAIAPIRDAAPVVAEYVAPMPYPALNGAFDALYPSGLQHYWKAAFGGPLTDGAIDAHMTHGPKVPVVSSTAHIYPINGAAQDVKSGATAFGHRRSKFVTVIAGMWRDPSQNDANIRWVREFYKAIAPFCEEGGYINFAAADDMSRVRANYGGAYDRLVTVKSKFDPKNVFRFNQNIVPGA